MTAVAFTLGTAAVSVTPAREAVAAPVLACKTAVNLFSVRPGGELWLYPHEEPEIGAETYGPIRKVGSGWGNSNTLAGPDGVLYQIINSTGDLHRYRWNGNGWDTWGGSQFRKVGSGWKGYTVGADRNKVTVDSQGRLYRIEADGRLTVYSWSGDDATGRFLGPKVLDTGWGKYDMVVASGDGVLYARETTTGNLFRFRWHPESDRLYQYALQVGTSWDSMTRLQSAGGDVLYATRNDGLLFWYRYYEETNTWAGRAKEIGRSWQDEVDVAVEPNACWINGGIGATRPSVPQQFDAPTTVVQGTDSLVTFFYVNSNGVLTAAKQRNLGDYEILEYRAISSYGKSSGRPGAAVRADGKLETLVNSWEDAEYRGRLQPTANGPWGEPTATPYGGWMASDPVILPEPNKALVMYAVDGDGALWHRAQTAVAANYGPWRKISTSGSLTSDFTVVRNGNGVDIVTRLANGTVQTATFTAGVLSAWRTVGTGATDRPAAVVHSNGALQIFVRTTDGKLATKREVNDTFPQDWQVIDGQTIVGSPAAALLNGSLVELAVRNTSNFVYQTGEVAPSGAYRPWQIFNTFDSATDPTSTVLSNGNPLFTWRSPDGVIQTSSLSSAAPSGAAFVAGSGRPQS